MKHSSKDGGKNSFKDGGKDSSNESSKVSCKESRENSSKDSIKRHPGSRITLAFSKRRAEGKKALITFVTTGDPDIITTGRIVDAMIAEGADLIELGVPYSDPIAEGPDIQAANIRALKQGTKIADVFSLVEELRGRTEVPIVLLLYVNVILKYGTEEFFAACSKSGIDGLIVPDLPYEERGEVKNYEKQYGVPLIRMISPVSGERIPILVEEAEGFLYCVSSLGVTGVRSTFETDFSDFFRKIDAVRKIPTALGFGISDAEQIKALKVYADGLIVGSAMVRAIARATNVDDAVNNAIEFTKSLRMALDS